LLENFGSDPNEFVAFCGRKLFKLRLNLMQRSPAKSGLRFGAAAIARAAQPKWRWLLNQKNLNLGMNGRQQLRKNPD
jgi:hypothetical protein